METKEVFEISKSFESDCRKINPFQYSIIHSRIDEYKTGLNKAFFSLARGPSASTDRHFENTSQYPKNIVSERSRLFILGSDKYDMISWKSLNRNLHNCCKVILVVGILSDFWEFQFHLFGQSIWSILPLIYMYLAFPLVDNIHDNSFSFLPPMLNSVILLRADPLKVLRLTSGFINFTFTRF